VSGHRVEAGGTVVDRSAPIGFTFDGRRYAGLAGDTLASALLANGVRIVSRSLKYRRPRGLVAAGTEEANGFVTVGEGARRTPNLKATEVELVDGLVAHSQRGWPSPRRDLGAVLGLLSPFLPAGFYYKTFMRPRRWWHHYERVLRRAASGATVPDEPEPDRHDRRFLACDVLVVGAGPAGLAAAQAAQRAGADVVVVDAEPGPGGSLLDQVGDDTAWHREIGNDLGERLLSRTTVFGRYDGERFAAVQRLNGGGTRYWHIQATTAVLATGAIERPLIFAGNDRPGVMLAGAARRYLARYGVAAGRRAVVLTNNDTAHRSAAALEAAGIDIAAVADTRQSPRATHPGLSHAAVKGRTGVAAIELGASEGTDTIACDLVLVSGGWTPTIHLHAIGDGGVRFDESWGAAVPETDGPLFVAGAAGGIQGADAIIADGIDAGTRAAAAAGASPTSIDPVRLTIDEGPVDVGPDLPVPHRGKAFVDLSTDVTVHDVDTARREGYVGPELVKRYTTLGMGPDQGKTGAVAATKVVADIEGLEPSAVMPTTYRPPFTPVPLGTLAARDAHTRIAPIRRSPLHEWHEANGAEFMPSGLWTRPKFFRRHGDDAIIAGTYEARAVRNAVGITDVSTLGKIELRGRDVAEFLERVYTNRWLKLPVGKVRYGVMLRDDGYVLDDGTTARLAEHEYLMTTTTGGAAGVHSHLEFYHQTVWPDLDVTMTSVTDQWAQIAVAGPHSRDLLQRLTVTDLSNDNLPFMGIVETTIADVPVRVARISFSGELGFEVAIPAGFGIALWEELLDAGQDLDVIPYGLEAMDYLRIEKGHLVVGADIDGRVSPHDVGLGGLVSTAKDFVGRRSLELPVFQDPDRQQLAGFIAVDRASMITAGAQLVAEPFDGRPQASLGRITSRAFSPALGAPIALGLVEGGSSRHSGTLWAASPVTGDQVEVEVVEPEFYDPDGERLRS